MPAAAADLAGSAGCRPVENNRQARLAPRRGPLPHLLLLPDGAPMLLLPLLLLLPPPLLLLQPEAVLRVGRGRPCSHRGHVGRAQHAPAAHAPVVMNWQVIL